MNAADDRAQREALDRVHMVPPKLARVLASGLRQTPSLELVAEWVEGTEAGLDVLVLQGGTGSAKSVAAAWAFEWTQHRAPITPAGHRRAPLWVDARALAAWSAFDARFWSAFDNASVIVIDDAGIEENGDRIAAAIERIVNVSTARAILTTNLGGRAFVERYGPRVISRLRGCGRWCVLADADYRTEAGRAELEARPLWPSPRDATIREVALRQREAEERRLADEEHVRTHLERQRLAEEAAAAFERAIADLAASKLSPFGHDDRLEADAARRRRIVDEDAEGELPAWLAGLAEVDR